MICKSCGSDFSEQLPLCPYCAEPRSDDAADGEQPRKSALEISGEIAGAAMAKAGEKAGVISENLGGLAVKTKAKAEAAGSSVMAGVSEAGSAMKQKFDDSGGFKGVADKLKKFLLFILKILKIISRYILKLLLIIFKAVKFVIVSVLTEFRENYKSRKFWVYIGIITVLVLIIIFK